MMMCLFCGLLFAQDSVDVTFRYNITPFPNGLEVRGEADNWAGAPAWTMQYQGGTLWIRNARLRVGGPTGAGVPGAYQYKFWHNGITGEWPNDPLNHHVNGSDNANTYIIVKNPTIYHLTPNQRTGTIASDFPVISSYIFPRVGAVVDTSVLSVTIDGVTYSGLGQYYNFTTKLLSFTSPVSLGNGGHSLILNCGTNADTTTFLVQVGGPPILPIPSYARHAVTLPSPASNDSTTFRLRVGGSTYVVLRVAPLGQPVGSATPVFMRKNPATQDWWMNLSLPPGTYEYQYQNSSGTIFNDPFGRESGTYGSRFTIGPAGLSADDYIWNSTSYQRPPLNKVFLYELNVGEFAGGYYGLPAGQAGFSELKNLMPYFDSIGINAIELMPVNDFGLIGESGSSWGYDVSSHFALDPSYGTPREFKMLIDSAHAYGIAVILDVVYNHLNDPGPLWQMQPDVVASPYFKLCTDLRYNEDALCFFRDMDHWAPETQEYVFEAQKMWIEQYRIDGFRYDYTQGIGWNIGDPSKGILGWANRIATDYGNSVYQIAEHLPESPALIFHSGMTGGWHDSFRDKIFDEARFENVSLIDFENLILDLGAFSGNDTPSLPNRYASRMEPVNATVTHDEQSLIYELITFQGTALPEAILRDKLYATFMATSLGIPMLWQGMEMSAPRGWMNDGQKLSYRPVEWYLLDSLRGQTHLAYYKALIRQRTKNPALFNGALRKLFRYTAEKTLVWGMEDSLSGAKVMCVANLSNADRTVNNVPWLAPGTWFDIFDQSEFVVGGATVPSMMIPAFTARVYSSVSDSILLDVERTAKEIPSEFALEQNYPNPFNPSTTIAFRLPERGQITLSVFDVLGREVAVLADGDFAAGSYMTPWNGRTKEGSQASSGVYFYRIRFVNMHHEMKSFTNKMILLK